MNFYKITNADGKEWIMPSCNMALGMQLYQPTAWKGKVLKRYFPLLNEIDCFGLIRKVLHINQCERPLSNVLLAKLQDLFSCKDIEYSVFNGTPCAHQKTTIQVYQGRKILGYCKVTKNPELIAIFQREEVYLNWLNECGMTGVPRCLCCQQIEDGQWIFVQTTTKTMQSTMHMKLGPLELGFLSQLADKTRISISFEQTEMFSWLKRLDELGCCGNTTVMHALKLVMEFYNMKQVTTFSAYHSDFTPWNMFVEDEELFVFDWEYAGRTYIPHLDIVHHIVQSSMFAHRPSARDLYDRLFRENSALMEQYFENPKIAVLCYLLDIFAKYAIRDASHETKDTEMLQKVRIELISLTLKNRDK